MGHNFEILDVGDKFFTKLYDKFFYKSRLIFGDFELSSQNNKNCWCYRSRNEDYNSVYHNHINTSTINAVYYYQIKKGDSISFLCNQIEKTYYPSKEELIIFPNYLIHKPNKPIGNNYRYSINMEIITVQSAKHLFNKLQ